ncbi:MAG: ABC transporter permease [Candidatus Heimdallarchaeota archaeon]|nr:ABC transporter permease [Candidatus Heimdallarchaeota archaeon]MCK5048026.1 ABC transporter permease [Candidatus Heimdallarchaeota archaeon]
MSRSSRIFELFKKDARILYRDRRSLGLLLLFPAIFMLIFSLAFSQGPSSVTTYPIFLVNYDLGPKGNSTVEGIIDPVILPDQTSLGEHFLSVLVGLTYENTSTKIFDITLVDPLDPDALEDVDKDLEKQEMVALVTIPQNFTLAFFDTSLELALPIKGDPSLQYYQTTYNILSTVLNFYIDIFSEGPNIAVSIDAGLVNVEDMTIFDFMAPGIMIFAVLLNVTGIASSLVGEISEGTIDRLRLTKMKTSEMLLGISLTYLVFTFFQVIIMFLTAVLVGYSPPGNLILGILVGTFAALPVIGIGLLVASFSKTPEQAGNLGAIVSVPLSFLSGSFFPVSRGVFISDYYKDYDFGILDFIPTTHAITAMRGILQYEWSLGEIVYYLFWLVLLTVIFFALGVFIFTKKHLKAQE